MPGLFDSLPEERPGGGRQVLTVSQLNALAREVLEERIGAVWVEGEISNLKRYPSGHTYFTLKDEAAQVGAVLFRGSSAALRFRPEDGLKVVARGRISLYEPRGAFQVIVETLEPAGLGALQLAFEQLKRRLLAEGLFDPARKRPLPALPRRIGVVASIAGAALRDILKVLERRFANLEVVIAPSRVQGAGAAGEIAAAIRDLNRLGGVDVLIVARGGGSIEDLWAFNEEEVARAIAASSVPVVSAIGHEVDVTIADLVADLRAPTPSAAAEMVVRSRQEWTAHVAGLRARLASAAEILARDAAQRVDDRQGGLFDALERRIAAARHRVAILAERMSPRRLTERIASRRDALAGRLRLLQGAAGSVVQRRRQTLLAASSGLDALSPLAVLGRGYAICFAAPAGAVVKDAASVAPGDAVRVRLHRGVLGCAVTEVEHGGRKEE
jgi:exodeoxyribonuclease VII large subunit